MKATLNDPDVCNRGCLQACHQVASLKKSVTSFKSTAQKIQASPVVAAAVQVRMRFHVTSLEVDIELILSVFLLSAIFLPDTYAWSHSPTLPVILGAMELGLGPTLDGFRSAIAECGAQQRWERALLLLTKLERRQLQADGSLLLAAMRACSMSAQWTQALHLLDTLEEKEVKMTARHCATAISALEPSGDWTRALSLLASLGLKDLQPTVDAYTWAICTCARASEWGKAYSLLDQMTEESVPPNEITYRQLAVLSRRAVLWEKGLQLLADVQASQIRWNVPVVLGAVSMSCIRAQEWQQAAGILAGFEGPLESNYFLNLVQIKILSERKQCEGWEAAFSWLSGRDELDEDVVCPVIRACGAQWQKALGWMLDLQEQGFVVTTGMYEELVRIRAAQDAEDGENYDVDDEEPLLP